MFVITGVLRRVADLNDVVVKNDINLVLNKQQPCLQSIVRKVSEVQLSHKHVARRKQLRNRVFDSGNFPVTRLYKRNGTLLAFDVYFKKDQIGEQRVILANKLA